LTFVGTMAFSVGLLRARLGKGIETLDALASGISKQTEVMGGVNQLLVELTRLHSPEHSGQAGFGTIELREMQRDHKQEFAIYRTTYLAHAAAHERDHVNLLGGLQRCEEGQKVILDKITELSALVNSR
jgi:hypothetical protein